MADLQQFLDERVAVSTTVVSVPVSGGIALRYDGNLLTFGSSDRQAETLDDTQYRVGTGPCLESSGAAPEPGRPFDA